MVADIEQVLLTEEQILARVRELGKQISADYAGKDLVLVGILRGGFVFLSDLYRAITIPATVDFMAINSYGNGSVSSGVVRIIKDLDEAVESRHVLLVDDVLDSGQTLSIVQRAIRRKKPLSCRTCVLLRKERAVKPKVEADWVGFHIEDVFVVGYGLDFDGLYRNIPDIAIMQPLG